MTKHMPPLNSNPEMPLMANVNEEYSNWAIQRYMEDPPEMPATERAPECWDTREDLERLGFIGRCLVKGQAIREQMESDRKENTREWRERFQTPNEQTINEILAARMDY